ncbi:MAG: DNA repair and recombination protein RadA [bacterium]|nr:DNA repair and recombination protein RadA [bacterium]
MTELERLTIDKVKIPGVGKVTIEKLKNAGFTDLVSIAAASPMELSVQTGISETTAAKIINAVREYLGFLDFETADKVLEKRQKVKKITTGSKNLDSILDGGIETGAITEVFGSFGSGKTQLAHMLSITVQLPPEQGGLGKPAVYIDAEGTFRPERIKEICENRGWEADQILKNIYVVRVYSSDHQEAVLRKLEEKIRKGEIDPGLVVVDSIMTHLRAEYVGRGELAERQNKLKEHLNILKRIADVYNVAVLITNQVQARPDAIFGKPIDAVGGHVLAHASTYRIWVRKAREEKRIARIVDAPHKPEIEAVFRITARGIED